MSADDFTTDATAARQHIQILRANGWSLRSIAAQARLSDTVVGKIAAGQPRCLPALADLILAIDPRQLPQHSYRGSDPLVPHTGTFRRIQALLAIGWSHSHIEAHTGIATGPLMAKARPRVRRSTHDLMAACYRDLATHPGPSAIARARAAARGYVSPAGWNDIDRDPHPDLGEPNDDRPNHDQVDHVVVDRILAGDRLTTTRAEKEAVVAAWTARGRTLKDLERHTGWKTDRYTRPAPTRDTAA
jgi:hypothetical protein